MPFLLAAILVVLSVRRKATAGQSPVVSQSNDTVRRTGTSESHLREEIQHLQVSGLSDDEALLIARHRLSKTRALKADCAQVPPYRQPAHRLYWMVVGILGYFFAARVSTLGSWVSGWLGYISGVRSVWLVLVTGAMYVAAFTLIVALALRYHVWRTHATTPRIWASLCVSLFAAATIVTSWWVMSLARPFLYRNLSEDGFVQVVGAWRWTGFGWTMLMPFLLAAVLAILSIGTSRPSGADNDNTQGSLAVDA